jgi:hypothetical protein
MTDIDSASRAPAAEIVGKTVVAHTVTYFVAGLLAAAVLEYGSWFESSPLRQFMRSMGEPMVMAGPLFQPVRGLCFGLVFWGLRGPFLERERGWLSMWLVLLALGVMNTFGPTPGSIEGLIYTRLRLADHVRGLPEIVLQSLALSTVVFWWLNHPGRRWARWVMGAAFVLALALPAVGLLAKAR